MSVQAATTPLRLPVRRTGPGQGRLRAAFADILAGLRLWELWLFLGWRDVRRHYSRTLLGPFWLTLSMGVLIGSLGLLYSRIFGMEIREYLPFLSVGFVLWNLISGAVIGGCTVFSNAVGFIRQTRLPFSLYVFKFVWSQLIAFAHNLAIYVVVALLFGVRPGFGVLLALPALGVLALNAVFAGLILGPLCARFRDVPLVVGSVVQVAFFLTPIIWHADQLGDGAHWVLLNPFYHLIEIVRDPLLGGEPRIGNWLAAGLFTLVHGTLALAFFARFRARIAYWA